MKRKYKSLKQIPLIDLVEISDSGTWGEKVDNDTSFPILRSSDIYEDKLVYDKYEKVVIPNKDIERKRLSNGDIIVTKSSGSAHLIGKCAIFNPPDDQKYYFSNFMLRLRTKKSSLYYKWLYYWLISPIGKFILLQLNDTTSGLRNLNLTLYTSQKIPWIELEEQKRIAEILDKADELRRKRRKAIEQCDEYLRSVFLDMFGDPVTNPKGWEVKKLEKVGTVKIGPFGSLLHREEYINNGYPLINPSHIINSTIVTDLNLTVNEEKYFELKQYQMKTGDIVLARRGEIGRCGLITKNEDGYLCGTGSLFIRPQKELNSVYLLKLISTTQIKQVLENEAKGITMKNLNSKTIGRLIIPVPSISIQIKFAEIVKKTEAIKAKMEEQLQQAEDMFNSLMQRAFKGEL